jgi:hypothetical protein
MFFIQVSRLKYMSKNFSLLSHATRPTNGINLDFTTVTVFIERPAAGVESTCGGK